MLVLAVVCILLFNVFVRLEYLVYPKDYSIFLYGLADKMLDEKEIRYYSYPLHLDGWDHLAIAKETIKKQTLIDYNPYLGEQIKDRNWEKAYTILLAETLLLTGIRPLIMEAVFPTVMGFILALNVFILLSYLTESRLAALLSAIYALSFKSSSTLTGLWFNVPVAYGVAMMPLILYIFLKALKGDNRWTLALAIYFTTVTLAHPPSAIIYLPIFTVYLASEPRLIKENLNRIIAACLLMLLLALYFAPAEKIINELSFGDEPPPGTTLNPYYFLGYPTLILALLGGLWCLKGGEKKILPLALLSLTPFIIQFYLTNELFLSPFRRLFTYLMMLALLVAGIGLWRLYAAVMEKLGDNKMMHTMVLWGLILLLLIQINSSYEDRHNLIISIIKDDVADYEQLQQTPLNSKILSNSVESRGVWFVGERRVIALTAARLRASDKTNAKADGFSTERCEKQKPVIDELKADYVISSRELNCSFLKETYYGGRGRNRIYEYFESK